MNRDERIELFRELLASVSGVCLTEEDSSFKIIKGNTEYAEVFNLFFKADDTSPLVEYDNADQIISHNSTDELRPVIYVTYLGLAWLSTIWVDDGLIQRIYMLGPVFLDDVSKNTIDKKIDRLSLSISVERNFKNIIKNIPVMPLEQFYSFGIMLHKAVTGNTIRKDEIGYVDDVKRLSEDEQRVQKYRLIYQSECEIKQMIREGNLLYREKIGSLLLDVWSMDAVDIDILRKAKDSIMAFCTECTTAAIEGGLSVEIAYELRNSYYIKVEKAVALSEVMRMQDEMVENYVRHVHRMKSDSGISPQIAQSCDYILMHLDEKPDIHALADMLGYSDYYFSTKFQKEVGMSVRDYSTKKRLEKGAEMLHDGTISIQDIADKLGFSSPSHFGKEFKKHFGITPTKYRNKL